MGAADVLASFSVTKVGAAANGAGNGAPNGTFEVENGKGVSTYRLPTKKELREREEWAARERANVVKMMGSSQDVEDVAVPTPLRTIPTDRNVWATPEAPQIALSREGCTATDTAQVPTTGDSGAGRRGGGTAGGKGVGGGATGGGRCGGGRLGGTAGGSGGVSG